MSEKRGIVEYFGSGLATYQCGYCKGQKPSGVDSSLWAHYLTADNYQKMIDRGWRRSGNYCYKPDLKKSCCPPYTIKCDALNFKLSKSQKKVLNTIYRFLAFGESRKTYCSQSRQMTNSGPSICQLPQKFIPEGNKYTVVNNELMNCDQVADNVIPCVADVSVSQVKPFEGDCVKINKAKVIRMERRLQKIMKIKNCSKEEASLVMNQRRNARILKYKQKSLEERINRVLPENAVHKLEILFSSTMDEELENFEVAHKLYQSYQMSIHNDKPEDCTPKQFKRFLINSPFEVSTVSNFKNNVNFKPEKYESTNCGNSDETLPKEYGSYHMQYWLDGEMIAVGVIDVLTKCVSSVYFFYDPKYEFLSLGTYSALREIHLTQKLHRYSPTIRDYYMGFYIHSCVKMRYKRKYTPSFLLCPEAFTWNPVERCLPLLDKNEYQRLELDLNKTDEAGENIPEDNILILYRKSAMQYSVYKVLTGKTDNSEVMEYAKLLGKYCVKCILLYRSN